MTTIDAAFQTDRATLVRSLKTILQVHGLLVAEEDLRPYECDGLNANRELPLAVCLPETEGQVVAVLRACHQLGVPVVARGAGTGVSGGAMPSETGRNRGPKPGRTETGGPKPGTDHGFKRGKAERTARPDCYTR